MKVGLLEIILIITDFQLLIFTGFLFSKKPIRTSNFILGIFLLSEAISLFGSFFYIQRNYFIYLNYPYLNLPLIISPIAFLWGPSFYLYVRSLAYKDFKLKWIHSVHLIPFILELFFLLITFYFPNNIIKPVISKSFPGFLTNHFFYIAIFRITQILIYNIISLYILHIYYKRLKDNFSSLTKINFSWLSFVIVGYTIVHILSTTVQVISFSEGFNGYLTIALYAIFLVFFNIMFFKAWQQPEIFSYVEESIKYKSSRLTKPEAEDWMRRLNEYIKMNKPYLNPGLTINQLAEDLEISPRLLSQIINEYCSQNFYDYINSLRIEESKIMLLDSSNRRTVLEILYDSGFNSKTAFNVAFKKTTGLTPTEFRKRTIKKSIPV